MLTKDSARGSDNNVRTIILENKFIFSNRETSEENSNLVIKTIKI